MTVFENIAQCLTLQGARTKKGRNATQQDLGIITDAALVEDGGIVRWVGPRRETPKAYAQAPRVSAEGAVWLPALVECHTHLVYGGERIQDYALRCSGKTYQEIAQSGGGILSTVRETRSASLEALIDRASHELTRFTAGVQCLEIKSGYGLTLESEIKMLEVVKALQKRTPLHLVPTFLPAHTVPPEFKGKADHYVSVICEEWIPQIASMKLATFFDAFVEEGYFTVDQTRKMCEAAQKHGLGVKLHVDQFTDQKGALLGAEMGAVSCDHLDNVSKEGIAKLAQSETVAVLAPGASLFTGTPYPPARALIDAGAIVALTTDFNPGTCPSHNLPLMLTLACSQMKMSIPEAIVAATFNAAQALNVQDSYGTIEVGRPFKVWKVAAHDFNAIPYAFGELD